MIDPKELKQAHEYLLGLWVNKQGWRTIDKCYVAHKLIRTDYPGPHIHDELGRYHQPPTIDYEFLRELPYEDVDKYLNALSGVVTGVDGLQGSGFGTIQIEEDELIALIDTTVGQRAVARFRSRSGG